MNLVTIRSLRQPLAWPGFLATIDLVRTVAFVGGCVLLFWQHDLAPVDWAFGIGIVASVLLWLRGRPAFDLAWPQPLLAVFLGVTAVTTAVAGGSTRFLVITIYLILASLAFASVLRGNERRQRATEMAIIIAGALTVGTIALGVLARQVGWDLLDFLNHDYLRSKGLFKDPNVAGGFVAAVFPLAASWSVRRPSRRLALLLAVTGVTGFGVIFSFSRLALLMFAIGFVGVAVALAVLRERRLVGGLLVGTTTAALLVVAIVGIGNLPLYRYQPIQQYDESGRFQAWGFGLQMFAEAPLGTGAGSYDDRAVERFRALVEAQIPAAAAAPAPVAEAAEPLPGFHSSWAGQSAYPRLRSGEASPPLTVTLRNTGSKPWTKGTPDQASLEVAGAGLTLGDPARPVATLATLVDLSRTAMPIRWPTATRVAVQDEAIVPPGALGRFVFQIRAPQTPGTYVLPLRPVVDSVGELEDQGILFRIDVAGTAIERPAPVVAEAPAAVSVVGAPAPYRLPPGALRVTDSAGLLAALESGSSQDIVLVDGVYDNFAPFTNAAGHRLYAANPGRAVLRAGLVVGANGGQGNGGLVQGIAFDVTDTSKTLHNSAVHIWGSGAGTRILDATFTGNRVVGSAIVARQVEGLVIQRVRIRDFTEFGIVVDANTSVVDTARPPLLEDIDVAGVGRAVPAAAFGPAEVCLRLGNTATVRRAQLRSCAWTGIWTGGASVGSVLERVDIDIARFGLFLDGGTAGNMFREVRLGPAVLGGILPTGRAMEYSAAPGSPGVAAAPAGSPQVSPAALTVTPAAHNLYLRVAVESGLIGLGALIAYLAVLLVGAIRRSSRLSWQWPLAFLVVLVAGLGIDTLHWRGLWIYAALIVATLGPSPFAGRSLWRARPAVVGRLEAPRNDVEAAGASRAPATPPPDAQVVDLSITRVRALLENRMAALGPTHPDVAMAMHELATMYHERGSHAEAEGLYLQAIRTYEQALSSDSPSLVWLLEDLASLRREQGRDRDADVIYARALAIIARTHGSDDRPTASKRAAYELDDLNGRGPAR